MVLSTVCWLLLQCTTGPKASLFKALFYLLCGGTPITSDEQIAYGQLGLASVAVAVLFKVLSSQGSNSTEVFNGLMEQGGRGSNPPCRPISSPLSGLYSNISKGRHTTSSEQGPSLLLEMIRTAMFKGILLLTIGPDVYLSTDQDKSESPRQTNVELPQAFPWRCRKARRRRGPRQYHLRMRIQRREEVRTREKLRKKRQCQREKRRREEKKRQDDQNLQEFQLQVKTKHWTTITDEERMEDYERNKSRYLHRSFLQYDLRYGVSLDKFVESIDPLSTIRNIKEISDESFLCSRGSRNSICHEVNPTSGNSRIQAALIAASELNPMSSENYSMSNRDERKVFMSENNEDELPIVLDSGASFALTPYLRDFVKDPGPCELKFIKGLSSETKVLGMGKVEWTIKDVRGQVRTIKCFAYYVPEASVRIFSPQSFFKRIEGEKGNANSLNMV